MALRSIRVCSVEFPHQTHEYDTQFASRIVCPGVKLHLWQLNPIERIEEGIFANLAAFPAIREGEQEWAPENSVTTQSLVAVECPFCWALVRDEKFTDHVTTAHSNESMEDVGDVIGYHEVLMGRVEELDDAEVSVDTDFHEETRKLERHLGARPTPPVEDMEEDDSFS